MQNNLLSTSPNEIKIPVIVHSELWYGVQKNERKEENKQKEYPCLLPQTIIRFPKIKLRTRDAHKLLRYFENLFKEKSELLQINIECGYFL
ncbi:MAG: hypothetical protein MK198_08805 [Gracilimonas sp.]|uniref:hypothetical protein n=1 Tax=Gracilimonas sp. TaxID=1974203 RepID=UPI0037519D30|nr:hypothetical protein [Gracilimonas sp.]